MWSRLEPAMQHTFGKEMHNYAIVPCTLHRCFKYVNDDGKVHRMFVDKKPLKGKKKIYFTYAARRKTSKLKQSQKQSYVWRKKARVKLKIALHHSSKSPSWIRHLTSSPASQPPKQSNLLIQMRRSQSRLSLKSNSQIDPLMISTKLSRPSSVEPFFIGTKKVWTLHPANSLVSDDLCESRPKEMIKKKQDHPLMRKHCSRTKGLMLLAESLDSCALQRQLGKVKPLFKLI